MDENELALFMTDMKEDGKTFESRLTLMRAICILQHFGMNFKFTYIWFRRAPYSIELARLIFKASEVFNEVKKIGVIVDFEEEDANILWDKFCEIIIPNIQDESFMDIASALCCLQDEGFEFDETVRLVSWKKKKNKSYNKANVLNIWNQISDINQKAIAA